MPKIEVYKGNKLMIPVDVAKKAKAYQCPWTDKIYATKRDYVKHLKQLRETRMHTRARNIVKDKIKQDLWNQPSFDSIIEWFSLHPEFLFDYMLAAQWESDRKQFEKYRQTFILEISHLDVRWSDKCSNTHNCPHNGITNWGGNTKLADGSPAPRGYKGWTGNIEFKANCYDIVESSVFRELCIPTGTGGSANGFTYGYEVTFFADDWPQLYKNHKEQMAEDILNNDNKSQIYEYKYGKPDYFKW